MSTTIPLYTGNADGNLITLVELAASGTTNVSWDISANFEGQVHVLNTPGAAVHATRGVRVQVYRRYGNGPTTGESAVLTYTLPSAVISTAESLDFFLGPGKWNIKLTNLDVTNGVSVEVTGDTITNLTTTA